MNLSEVGSIVRIVAPGSREIEGRRENIIPAVVIGQYPDGKIDLYCLHFQGSPLLAHAIDPEFVEVIFNPGDLQKILKRLDDIEKHISSGKALPAKETPRFTMAPDNGAL